MKRRHVHAGFATVALACAGAAAFFGWQRDAAREVDTAAAAAAREPVTAGAAAAPREAPPEVRLARAQALSRGGEHDAAFRGFSSLMVPGTPQALRREALYGLGNLYARQARAAAGPGGTLPPEAQPLGELAKQRYRDLLREDPADWDARHNLERVLRLAPEDEEGPPPVNEGPVERRQLQLRGMTPGALP